jgi:hypothetical protein
MKTQPSNWHQMSDALRTLADGYAKVAIVEQNGGFQLPALGTLPPLNGKTNGHANGHAAKALPAPHKVKKAAAKALPAPAAERPSKAPTAKGKAIVKAKAEKAATVKAKPAKGTTSTSTAIAAGRRAVTEGLRPKLVDAVAIVMGDETLKAGEILERLVARGWEPGAKAKQAYISYTLSDNEEVFKRGNRGEYSVIRPKQFAELAAQWKSAKAEAPKAKGGKTSGKAEGVVSTDADAETLTAAPEAPVAEAAVKAKASVAGDPPTETSDTVTAAAETVSTPVSTTDQDLEDLGLGQEIADNPFHALSNS